MLFFNLTNEIGRGVRELSMALALFKREQKIMNSPPSACCFACTFSKRQV